MLASRIRSAVCALLTLSMGCASLSLLRGDAQEVGKPTPAETKLKGLLDERAVTTKALAKQTRLRIINRAGELDELLVPTRLAHEAALDVCATDAERIMVLENFLADAKENEKLATNANKAGQGRETSMLAAKAERLRVEIALERARAKQDTPRKGGDAGAQKENTTKNSVLPCTLEAFESVRLVARVSGYLKTQSVDIGDRVKRGQVLVVLDVPELDAQVQHDQAGVVQAMSRVAQAKARLNTVTGDLEAAKLNVIHAEAAARSAAAATRERAKQYQRIKELHNAKSVEDRLVDEAKERHDAALESEQASKASIALAKAHVATAENEINQAKTDIAATEADVKLAQTRLEKARVTASFASITAPVDGIVIQRAFATGDFIRGGDKEAANEPVLTVQRTDRMRVVVAVPDRDVPFVEVGDTAEIEFDALPGKKFSSKVARIAGAIDAQTRCMRVEIDLANATGQLRSGMYGRVTLSLHK